MAGNRLDDSWASQLPGGRTMPYAIPSASSDITDVAQPACLEVACAPADRFRSETDWTIHGPPNCRGAERCLTPFLQPAVTSQTLPSRLVWRWRALRRTASDLKQIGRFMGLPIAGGPNDALRHSFSQQ